MIRIALSLAAVAALLFSVAASDGDTETWRSALYPADWEPGLTDDEGRFLHDFSYAGYHNGEAPIPTAIAGPVQDVVADHGADPTGATDSTAAIQAAINAAEVAGGGVVRFPEGHYRIDGQLVVDAPGVVLRGEGADMSRLQFTQCGGMDGQAHLTFRGTVRRGDDHPLAEDAPNRATSVRLADSTGLDVGDEVAIGFTITNPFREAHGMGNYWAFAAGQWRGIHRREITAIDRETHIVTFTVPLRTALEVAHGASVRAESGYLAECGLEDLGIANAVDYAAAWGTNQVAAVALLGVKDCWVRGVRSFAPDVEGTQDRHLQSCGIRVKDGKRVTIKDCVLSDPQHRGGGGNGYLFEIRQSNEILTVDCAARRGRHNFIQNWDFGTTGCVWLRITSAEARANIASWDPIGYPARSEYHHSLAMANLVDDSRLDDGWNGYNRQGQSSGAGHTCTECVYWRTRGTGTVCSACYGWGYVIGTGEGLHVSTPAGGRYGDHTAPEDYTEGLGQGDRLRPESLYEDQLARRTDR